MKKEFNAFEMEVNSFTVEDVITTSGGGNGNTGSFDGEPMPFPPPTN